MLFSYAATLLFQLVVFLIISFPGNENASRFLQNSKAVLYFFNIVVAFCANAFPFYLLAKAWKIRPASFIRSADIGTTELFLYTMVCIGVNLAGILGVHALSALLERFGLPLAAPSFHIPDGDISGAIMLLLYACIVAPMIEEFIFRGVLLRLFGGFGLHFAAILSSALFGIFHGNLYQALPAFLIGLVLCTVTLKTGSVWPAMAIHSFNNSLALILQNRAEVEVTVSSPLTAALMLFQGACLIGVLVIPLIRRELFTLPKLPRYTKGNLRKLLSNPAMLCALLLYIGSMLWQVFSG